MQTNTHTSSLLRVKIFAAVAVVSALLLGACEKPREGQRRTDVTRPNDAGPGAGRDAPPGSGTDGGTGGSGTGEC